MILLRLAGLGFARSRARWLYDELKLIEFNLRADRITPDDVDADLDAMGVHTGTHMDAPVHFIHQAAGVDQMPLTATMGPARVIEITDPREITADELREHRLQAGERVLFRTSNSPRCWQADRFVEDFVYISEPAAEYLAETRVRTVGVDYLSVGGYHADGAKIHRILLTAGIWIIEGLDLSAVRAGRYDMICLPVKLHGSDGAPARAILRPIA